MDSEVYLCLDPGYIARLQKIVGKLREELPTLIWEIPGNIEMELKAHFPESHFHPVNSSVVGTSVVFRRSPGPIRVLVTLNQGLSEKKQCSPGACPLFPLSNSKSIPNQSKDC